MQKKYKKILIISAHHDDIEMGCGGSVAKLIASGYQPCVIVVCDSGYKNIDGKNVRSSKTAKSEGMAGLKTLGIKEKQIHLLNFKTNNLNNNFQKIKEKILKIIKNTKFDVMFSHDMNDVHPDHKLLAEISISIGKKIEINLFYKSNFYQTYYSSVENFYIDISKFFEIKIKAIKEHKSEMERTNNIWLNFFKNKNLSDGIKNGCYAAEAFYCPKIIIR